ncbi:hypothetical protein V502_02901 [Pseudogymnoascus sp. VKM F-4520 (FW-2644)]|nr:hypothetical protein V502_02901 [Pseudogymnoascus sp. VKM F-4520 (FW-2644)]
MASNTTLCLSGSQSIALTSNVCNPGFYCPNNSAENPPQYCLPTPECRIRRLQFANNICEQPQGRYEPIVCSPGFYCPPGGVRQQLCPRGHYCPLGSVKPLRCLPLSICPSGSIKQLHLVGILCCVLLDVLLLGLWMWHRKKKAGESIEMSPVHHEGGYTHDIGSVLMGESTYFVGLDIKFNCIGYRIRASGKHILTGISGTAQKGSLLGIMGPSGSGKSTLVNILSGKLHATSGSMSVQGVEMSLSDLSRFKDLIGYVPQDDIVHPYFTVRENLLFSGRIRLGGVVHEKQIERRVDQLIDALGLTKVKDSLVGDQERRGISGGERKRISIGLELIAAPKVLILDEPTSGLDAQAALSIIMLLKTLSRHGITVICVVHQPRLEIFASLDTLLLLGSGKQIYFGPRSETEQYFKLMGYEFDPQLNPADMILDIVAGLLPPSSSMPLEDVGNEKAVFESLEEVSQIPSNHGNLSLEQLIALHALHKKRTLPWYWQLYLCFCRDLMQQNRDAGTFVLEVFAGILTGILIGLALYEYHGQLYQGLFLPPFEPLSSAVNYTLVPQVGMLCCLAISFASAAPSVSVFSVERLLFCRESHSGHSESAYLMGKVLTSLIRTFLSALHFTTCFMILATPVISFGMLLGLNLLYFYCIYGIGSIVAAVTKRENSPLVCLLVTIVMGIFAGYAPRLAKVQEWHLAWFWYSSPGMWFNEAFFTGHTWKFSYLYDRAAADSFTGYTTGRTGFDISRSVFLVGHRSVVDEGEIFLRQKVISRDAAARMHDSSCLRTLLPNCSKSWPSVSSKLRGFGKPSSRSLLPPRKPLTSSRGRPQLPSYYIHGLLPSFRKVAACVILCESSAAFNARSWSMCDDISRASRPEHETGSPKLALLVCDIADAGIGVLQRAIACDYKSVTEDKKPTSHCWIFKMPSTMIAPVIFIPAPFGAKGVMASTSALLRSVGEGKDV